MKTAIVTGGSQGIGLAIALRFAKTGAQVALFTKDSTANMERAAKQLEEAGGKALLFPLDVTDDQAMQRAVEEVVKQCGGVDVLVNNTSATHFQDVLHISPEHFDRVMGTSVRAAFFLSQACFLYLKKSRHSHVINIAPPLNLDPYWFKDHLAFSIGKYGMSLCTLGLAERWKKEGISVNSLWPETTIATQTIKDHFSDAVYRASRWPSIMGDAAYELFSKKCTGRFYTDEMILREVGVTDFSRYAVDPNVSLMQALFIPEDQNRLRVSQDLFL